MSASMAKIIVKAYCQFYFKCTAECTQFAQIIKHRGYSSSLQTTALLYAEYGDPLKVVKSTEIEVEEMNGQSLRVQMLIAPINPADINTIQGVYPVKPQLPAVGGFEGVGRITEVGNEVTHLKPGDIVLPAINAFGTWRNEIVCSSGDVIPIPPDTPLIAAATLKVNGCTAYRMLTDYEQLAQGDSIIQNGANSSAGQAVIQIAAARGIHTVNIIRDRPNVKDLKTYLESIGASVVLTEEEMRKEEAKELLKSFPKAKLALNAVGGKSAINLLKCLQPGGTIVTYGGMSRQPLMVPTGALIFNDIKIVGFWITRWHEKNSQSPEARKMILQLCEWAKHGQLRAPQHREVPFKDYQSAIEKTMEAYASSKQMLRFDC